MYTRRGTLGPGEYGVLTVTYAPQASGAASFRRFAVVTPGGNRAPLRVRGKAEGPRVTLSARVLDFGSVRAGQEASKVVYIENASEVAAAYEFRDDGGGVFELSQPRGVVGPRSAGHTRVTFAPGLAANYWRRLVCVFQVGVTPFLKWCHGCSVVCPAIPDPSMWRRSAAVRRRRARRPLSSSSLARWRRATYVDRVGCACPASCHPPPCPQTP
jgi:hypothetical protein